LGNYNQLEELNLWGNNLSGYFPSSIGNISSLQRLWIDGNNFTGNIPESIGYLENLYTVNLSFNQFSGTIPQSLCNLGLDWNQWNDGITNGIHNNYLCPPYPDCMDEQEIGEQNTSECEELSNLSSAYSLKYKLNTPYPNPFNPATQISYQLPQNEDILISVYDMSGKHIKTLVKDYKKAGFYTANWDASPYPSGTYLIKMQSGPIKQTQKVVLIK